MHGRHHKAERFIGQPRQALHHMIKIGRSQIKSKNQVTYIRYQFIVTNYRIRHFQHISLYIDLRKQTIFQTCLFQVSDGSSKLKWLFIYCF